MSFKISGASGPPYLKLTSRNSMWPSKLCTGVRRERSRPCSGSCSKISLRRFIKTDANCRLSQTPSVRRIPAYAIAVSELNATKPPTLRLPLHHLVRADPEENRRREQADRLQHAVVRHEDEIGAENLLRDGEELVQHRVAEHRLGRRSFDRFDSFDRIDLMRAVFALAFLDVGEQRPQDFDARNTSVRRRAASSPGRPA